MNRMPASVKEAYLFRRAYQKGKSVARKTVAVYLLPRRKDTPFSLGVTVSKKLGGAVARNRVKRLVRESARLLCGEFPSLLNKNKAVIVVARGRAFASGVKCDEIMADLRAAFSDLGLLS